MNFWATADGSSAKQDDGKFEMGGDALAPIPEDTSVLAIAEEAKNNEYQGDEYINVKWRISKPAEYANRVIFQKVRAYDSDATKADKAKRMLAAIAANAGGGLFSTMEQRGEERPSDMSLSQICNRPMVLKLGAYVFDKDKETGKPIPAEQIRRGNWIKAVSPAKAGTAAPAPKPAAKPKPAPAPDYDSLDDDIPFANPYRGVRALLV